MLKRKGFSFGALALATGSALATVPAWAAGGFPTGAYSAKGGATAAMITFDEKGRLRVDRGGHLKVEADYTVKGDQFQLTDKRGPWACMKTGQRIGLYRWKSTTAARWPSPRWPTSARRARTA